MHIHTPTASGELKRKRELTFIKYLLDTKNYGSEIENRGVLDSIFFQLLEYLHIHTIYLENGTQV